MKQCKIVRVYIFVVDEDVPLDQCYSMEDAGVTYSGELSQSSSGASCEHWSNLDVKLAMRNRSVSYDIIRLYI